MELPFKLCFGSMLSVIFRFSFFVFAFVKVLQIWCIYDLKSVQCSPRVGPDFWELRRLKAVFFMLHFCPALVASGAPFTQPDGCRTVVPVLRLVLRFGGVKVIRTLSEVAKEPHHLCIWMGERIKWNDVTRLLCLDDILLYVCDSQQLGGLQEYHSLP